MPWSMRLAMARCFYRFLQAKTSWQRCLIYLCSFINPPVERFNKQHERCAIVSWHVEVSTTNSLHPWCHTFSRGSEVRRLPRCARLTLLFSLGPQLWSRCVSRCESRCDSRVIDSEPRRGEISTLNISERWGATTVLVAAAETGILFVINGGMLGCNASQSRIWMFPVKHRHTRTSAQFRAGNHGRPVSPVPRCPKIIYSIMKTFSRGNQFALWKQMDSLALLQVGSPWNHDSTVWAFVSRRLLGSSALWTSGEESPQTPLLYLPCRICQWPILKEESFCRYGAADAIDMNWLL